MSTKVADERQSQSNSVEPAADQPAAPRKTSWGFRLRLSIALLIPIFFETLDYTVVATAQPHIASNFNRLDLQGWIGTVYLLTSTVFIPLYGSLADVFGRHWALQTSLVWFLLGSALSTGAQNMPMMLAGRGIAGIGAAGLLTVVQVVLTDTRSMNENSWQLAMVMVLYTVGYTVGPVIGGALISVSFRWVFGINLPASLLAMILIFVLIRRDIKGPQPSARQRIRESRGERGIHKYTWSDKLLAIDFVGAALFIAGGLLLLLGLTWGSTEVWNQAKVIASIVIGGVLVVLCLIWECVIEHYDDPERGKAPPRILEAEPMIPIPVIKHWDTIICQYTVFTSGMVMLSLFYFAAIFFTVVSGQDPTKAGVQLVYFTPGIGVGVIISINMFRFLHQPKYPIILGSTILPIALGLMSMAIANNNNTQVNVFMAMAGAGVGMTFAPVSIHARFSMPEARVAVVQSLQLFFRTFGGTVGLAQCSTVLNSKVKSALVRLVASDIIPPSSASQASVGSIGDISSLPPEIAAAVRDAFRDGVRWAFISLIPWSGLAVFLALSLSKIKLPDSTTNPTAVRTNDASEKPNGDASSPSNAMSDDGLGAAPTKKGIIGPIGLIIYLVRKNKWETRRRKLEESRRLEAEEASNKA